MHGFDQDIASEMHIGEAVSRCTQGGAKPREFAAHPETRIEGSLRKTEPGQIRPRYVSGCFRERSEARRVSGRFFPRSEFSITHSAASSDVKHGSAAPSCNCQRVDEVEHCWPWVKGCQKSFCVRANRPGGEGCDFLKCGEMGLSRIVGWSSFVVERLSRRRAA